MKLELTKCASCSASLRTPEVLIDDKCVYDQGSFHSLGSPHSTSRFRLKIKSPPFVLLAPLQLKTAPSEAGLPREDELTHCGPNSFCRPLWLCALFQHRHTRCWPLNLPSDSRALVGDCSVPSPKQDGLDTPFLVPPAEA